MSDWLSEPERPHIRQTRQRAELALQKTVMQFLGLALPPDAVAMSIPNEGYRSRRAGGELKAAGLLAGAPDLLIVYRGKALFIELKSATGWVSREQRQVHKRLWVAGCDVMLCRSVEQVEASLREAGVPLRASQGPRRD